MGIVARIALTYARGHDRLSAAAGGGDRPRRDAAWRQRGRCRGDVRIRAGRHRSTDVRPRRVRRDARAQSAIRRGAHRVLRDGRVTRPRGPMGIDVHSRSRRSLRIRPRRPGQRRRLPGGGGAGYRRWSSRGAHQVRFDLVGGGDRTGDPAGSTWLPCPRIRARLLDDRLRAGCRAQRPTHPGDSGREGHLHARRPAVRDRRGHGPGRPGAHAGEAGDRRS